MENIFVSSIRCIVFRKRTSQTEANLILDIMVSIFLPFSQGRLCRVVNILNLFFHGRNRRLRLNFHIPSYLNDIVRICILFSVLRAIFILNNIVACRNRCRCCTRHFGELTILKVHILFDTLPNFGISLAFKTLDSCKHCRIHCSADTCSSTALSIFAPLHIGKGSLRQITCKNLINFICMVSLICTNFVCRFIRKRGDGHGQHQRKCGQKRQHPFYFFHRIATFLMSPL